MAFKMSGMNFGEGTGYQAPQSNPRVVPPAPTIKAGGSPQKIVNPKVIKKVVKKIPTQRWTKNSPTDTAGESSPQKAVPAIIAAGAARLGLGQAAKTGTRIIAKKLFKKGVKSKVVGGVTKVWNSVKGWILPTAAYYLGKVTGKGEKEDAGKEAGKAAGKTTGPGTYVKPGGKATGKMKDYPLGSAERKAEYDARGWKYDDTIAGYNRDGSKKEEKVKPVAPKKTEIVVPKPGGVKDRGPIIGAKKIERGEDFERKTKGGSLVEGKKIKERQYDAQGNLITKIKEKYRGKGKGGEGIAQDWWKGRMKKQKIKTKDAGTVTKTKTKYDKYGNPITKTKTRKRRLVGLGKLLAGKRSGEK